MNYKNRRFFSLAVIAGMLSCASMVGMDIGDAILKGDLERIKQIVEADKAMVNKKDNDGWTSLHHAALWNMTKVMEYLIKKDATVDMRENYGSTPLHIAAGNGCLEAVKYLIKKNATVDIKNNETNTPLHWAAQDGFLSVVTTLCEVFSFNTTNEDYNCRQAQKLLGLLSIKNIDGATALDLAEENKQEKTVAYLTEIQKKAAAVNPLLTTLKKAQKVDVEFAYLSEQ